MRITEAAARLGMSPRMLRYREDLGLLPPLRDRPYGRGHAHRQFTEEDLAAITAALAYENGRLPRSVLSRIYHPTLELYLETKSVVTYTGSRPTNPFGL